MGINPLEMMQFNGRMSTFGNQHPKVVAFFKENGHHLQAGNIVEFKIKTPEGIERTTNLRLTQDDEETINILKKALSNN